jgi:2,4-dienoyl-CoA reductase-like NADH-dependent reductase (Old Yellow Enzyme family)
MLLMQRIQFFLKRAEMTPTRFGREAIGDPRLVKDMKNGRELRECTAARIHAWLDAQEKQA